VPARCRVAGHTGDTGVCIHPGVCDSALGVFGIRVLTLWSSAWAHRQASKCKGCGGVSDTRRHSWTRRSGWSED
jgi:hypothetical protein